MIAAPVWRPSPIAGAAAALQAPANSSWRRFPTSWFIGSRPIPSKSSAFTTRRRTGRKFNTVGSPTGSMHRHGMLDVTEAVGGAAAALLDVDRVQLALDVLFPEFEKLA